MATGPDNDFTLATACKVSTGPVAMSLRKIMKYLFRRRVQLALYSGISLACLVATAILTAQVFLKLDEYKSSNRDNMPWTITQLQVDQLKLINAIVGPDTLDPEKLQILRQRFDILYSRTQTIKNGESYKLALADTAAGTELSEISETLDRMVTIIDADDASLIRQRQLLLDATTGLTDPIRRLSAAGIMVNARLAEVERSFITSKLVNLSVLSLLMLLALLSLMILLWRLYHLYRKRAFQNRITLNRLATILNTSQDAILVVDATGKIIDTNGAAETMFALLRAAETPVSISQVLFSRSDDGTNRLTPLSAQKLTLSCANGPNRSTNLIARNKTGLEFPVELSANKAARSGDEVCVCFIRDITNRLKAEADVRSARDKALVGERAKARFLGMISHEMRTPLNGILGSLDLLEETGLREDQERYSKIMKSSGQLLLNQINDALDVTQADAGRLTLSHSTFDLDDLLLDLLHSQQPIAAAQDNSLTLLKPETNGELVQGDRDRVNQVLLNLIANAIKFTRGGEIAIEVTRLGGPDNPTDEVEFQISDTGIGIAESDLPRIFDDFVRLTDPNSPDIEGTGLGLGIARHLVSLMNGKIGAESVKGEGSLFWVRIPLPRAHSDVTLKPDLPDEARKADRMDILVVEDNFTNRQVLCELLQKDGHRVTLAVDGPQGVAAANQTRFDVIFMDINMPGFDGIEASRRIRNEGGPCAGTRIIALTAHYQPEHDLQMQTAGFDAVQSKPLRRSVLRQLLAGDQQPPEPPRKPANIDWEVLDQLTAVLPDRKIAKLLDGFESEGQGLIDGLPSLKAEGARQFAARLHSFAGTAATLGAVSLQSMLSRAETFVIEGDLETADQFLDDLPKIWLETLQEIQQHCLAA